MICTARALRRRLLLTIASVVCVASLAAGVASAAYPAKPNILFIFADDQAFDTLQIAGNDEIRTPHLDRLAKRGVRFTHAYNQGSWSGAVCVASRTMLNTGRFLWHADAVYRSAEKERQAGRFWSEYMKAAGYDTYMTGKWHVPADAAKAFQFTAHIRGGMPNQTPAGYNRPLEGQPDPWSPSDPKFGGFWAGGKHWSEVVAEDAVGFLQQAADRENPFFMYIAFNAPHDPRQSPQEFVDMYPLGNVAVPESFVPEYPHKDAMGCGKSLRDEKLAPFPRTEYAVKVNRQEYYAIITHMDVQIGRILDALEATGKADETYVFFSADHGLAVGRHGLMGKQNMFEHSVRVPLLVSGPGIEAGKVIDGAVYLQDIMATTLELAGIEKPSHVEFLSLLPVIEGRRAANYDSVYGAYLQLQRSVTKDGFKLILYPRTQVALLYHIAEDPLELQDLIDEPKYQAVARQLFAELLKLQEVTGDKLDLISVYPKLQNG